MLLVSAPRHADEVKAKEDLRDANDIPFVLLHYLAKLFVKLSQLPWISLLVVQLRLRFII